MSRIVHHVTVATTDSDIVNLLSALDQDVDVQAQRAAVLKAAHALMGDFMDADVENAFFNAGLPPEAVYEVVE